MATIHSVRVDCPACGEPVEVPLTTSLGERDGNTVPVTLTPDLTPITAHAAEHREDQ